MNRTEMETLRVPGATLSYEVYGKGPILLFISGGGNDSHSFDKIIKNFIDQYTVVTYNRRGLSQSTLDDPQEEQFIGTHSDDAHRLLQELGSEYEPAYVFGSSGGAVVGLDLVARHPEQVRVLIAHEPPTHLSSKIDPIREMAEVRDVYRRKGMLAAMQKLMALPGIRPDNPEIDSQQPEMSMEEKQLMKQQNIKNATFLFEQEFAMYDRYQLDFSALKHASTQTKIMIASGNSNESAGYWSSAAIAERLGTPIVEFPGHHVGYMTNPLAFSRRLHAVLEEASQA